MSDARPLLMLVATALLWACSPTFNWRDVRAEQAPLTATLPCKPDRGSKSLPLGGAPTEVHMMGCETGGALFTVASATLPPQADVAAALAQWKQALLATAKSPASSDRPFAPDGAMPLPQSLLASFRGQQPDGRPVDGQVAFFAQGRQVFQAAVLADKPVGEAAEVFFAGLRLTP